jgi:hypothetical protein
MSVIQLHVLITDAPFETHLCPEIKPMQVHEELFHPIVRSDVIQEGLKNIGSEEQRVKENTKKRVFPWVRYFQSPPPIISILHHYCAMYLRIFNQKFCTKKRIKPNIPQAPFPKLSHPQGTCKFQMTDPARKSGKDNKYNKDGDER